MWKEPPRRLEETNAADNPAAEEHAEDLKGTENTEGNWFTLLQEQADWEYEDEPGTAVKAEAADSSTLSPVDAVMIKGVTTLLTPLHARGQETVETKGWQDVWGLTPRLKGRHAEIANIGANITITTIPPHRATIKVNRPVHHQRRGSSSCGGYGARAAVAAAMLCKMPMNVPMIVATSCKGSKWKYGVRRPAVARRRRGTDRLAPPRGPGSSWSTC